VLFAYFRRLSHFTVLSGIGWCIDFGLMLLLVWNEVPVFLSNVVGAVAATIFVYLTAQRHVFKLAENRLGGPTRFMAYAGYQAIVIAIASFLIDAVAGMMAESALIGDPRLAAAMAKISITPLTMYSNFLFMGWLVEGRLSWR